ncbi:MAG: hypothetical protein R3Y63_05840 [Eubacteriales bacterium]
MDYLRDKKIVPDMAVPSGIDYNKQYQGQFMDFIRKMSVIFSYKPVLVQAFFENIDEEGKAKYDA